LDLPNALLTPAIPSQEINGRTASCRSTVYAQLISTTSEVIAPTIAPRVKQGCKSTGSAIECFGRIAFE
jgi:hypothetical protein